MIRLFQLFLLYMLKIVERELFFMILSLNNINLKYYANQKKIWKKDRFSTQFMG